MKLKMQLDLDEVEITKDTISNGEIKVFLPILQGEYNKAGFGKKYTTFKTGFSFFLKRECALSLIKKLQKALSEAPKPKEEPDDLDIR